MSQISPEKIQKLIHLIREQKVILDIDLAELYEVETGALNRAVKRNMDRFPSDFMFQLTEEESLRCHFGISKKGRGGRRYRPYVFTESGIAMLSSVLNSKRSIHQKSRKLENVISKLTKLQDDIKNGVSNICFGSKKLFLKQFNLEANGYANHEEWKEDWINARNSSFYLVGSKDESYGNQSCQLTPNGNVKIRVPNQLVESHGKFITINNIAFNYQQDQLHAAIGQGVALTHRFICKNGDWYLHTSFNYRKVEVATLPHREVGAIGVDFNAKNVATSETDRSGNLIKVKTYNTDVSNKSKNQTLAIYGDCCKLIVEQALREKKAIIVEQLDFTKKRSALKESGKKYARMLSSFAYSSFLNILKRRAYREGVAVYDVNPAYTSIIGKIKFMGRYGITPHESAALSIARRISSYSEKIPSKSASPSLEKMKGQHVWKKWYFILKTKVGGGHHIFYQWRSLQDAAGLSFNSFDVIFSPEGQKTCGVL